MLGTIDGTNFTTVHLMYGKVYFRWDITGNISFLHICNKTKPLTLRRKLESYIMLVH